jgi:hypothetical protein
LVTAIVVIGAVLWFFFNLFDRLMTEGNPGITFFEMNETIAASFNFSHLTEQDYNEFPQLREIGANPRARSNWSNGYRYLGTTKISEQQNGFILRKGYAGRAMNGGFLEYQGKYYSFSISLS